MKSTKSILLATVFVACGHLLIKYGLNSLGGISFSAETISQSFALIFTNFYVVLGVVFFALSSVLWLASLSKNDLSYAYPFLSIGYALVAFLSWLVLGESLSSLRVVGILTVCAGIILMSRS